MKSTLRNMVFVLLAITLAASTAVGIVYRVTTGPIDAAEQRKTIAALSRVLPPFDNNPAQQVTEVHSDGLPVCIYTATRAGQPAGYAVQTVTQQGYGGEIRMVVGFDAAGDVVDIEVLQHNETPGLGSKMTEEDNPLVTSFRGKNPGSMQLSVRKDGGEVDALTASTISSRAYIDAVARAYNALAPLLGSPSSASATDTADAATGATGSSSGKTDAATGATISATATADAATGATAAGREGGKQ